jgi:hypothetical protein
MSKGFRQEEIRWMLRIACIGGIAFASYQYYEMETNLMPLADAVLIGVMVVLGLIAIFS